MAMLIAAKNANLESFKLTALQQAADAAEIAAKQIDEYPPALTPVTVAQFLLESNRDGAAWATPTTSSASRRGPASRS